MWVNSSCLVLDEGDIDGCVSADDPQERLLSATTDNFASDRKTGLAVNDPKYLPAEAEPHEGLVNKWPFESEKKTYPYWDALVGDTVDAVYDRTEEVDGLETYVYKVSISDAPIEITDGVPGTYDDEKEIWVEPVTGAIVDQSDSQVRLDEDGEVFLALDISFTDEEVAESVEDAKSNVRPADPRHLDGAADRLHRRHPDGHHRHRAARDGSPQGARRPSPTCTTRRRRSAVEVASRRAPKIAVPGVKRPRTPDHPPQTRSWPSGHSGSSRSVSRNPLPASSETQSPERAVVLDVRHLAGRVVHLDVRRPVPVGLAGDQARPRRGRRGTSSGSGA